MTDVSAARRDARGAALDLPDQILFFLLFFVGAVAIWALKLLHFSQTIVTVVPIGLMVFYALIALVTKRYRIREDKVGDNLYYLGFLYTLVSLSYALYIYDPDGSGATDIITNFGIAIFTTIFGLAGRVFFNQMREDPVEYEREARQSLAQATNELRAHLADICVEMSNFKRKSLQIMEEGATDITNSARATLAQNVERFAETSNEVVENIRAAFSSFTDHSSRLNEIAAKNVEALQALFDRIQRIEASPDLVAQKLEPIIQKFGEVADETLRRNRAQTNDLKRVRDIIDVAVAAAEGLRKSLEASDKGLSQRLERFTQGLEQGVANAARFTEVMATAATTLKTETEETRRVIGAIGTSADVQKRTLAEVHAAIASELQVVQQHREASARMLEESRAALQEVERSLVSLSRALVEQLGGR